MLLHVDIRDTFGVHNNNCANLLVNICTSPRVTVSHPFTLTAFTLKIINADHRAFRLISIHVEPSDQSRSCGVDVANS